MKIFLTIILLVLSNIHLYSQEGIGKFKINKSTIDVIKDVGSEIGKTYEIINFLEFYNNHYNGEDLKFQEIIMDTTTICKNSRIFYLSEYTISNIKLKEIYLVFFKEILVEFRCIKSKELDLLFSKKYGRPYIFEKLSPDLISNILKYDEHMTKFIWRKNNITTISFEKKQVFGGITRDAGSYFIIYDMTHRKIIEDCDIFDDNFENKIIY